MSPYAAELEKSRVITIKNGFHFYPSVIMDHHLTKIAEGKKGLSVHNPPLSPLTRYPDVSRISHQLG